MTHYRNQGEITFASFVHVSFITPTVWLSERLAIINREKDSYNDGQADKTHLLTFPLSLANSLVGFHSCVTVSLLLFPTCPTFDFEWSPVTRRRCQVGTMSLVDSFSYPLCFINKIGVIPKILFFILLHKEEKKIRTNFAALNELLQFAVGRSRQSHSSQDSQFVPVGLSCKKKQKKRGFASGFRRINRENSILFRLHD